MLKKYINIFFSLVLVLFTFIGFTFFHSPESITTFKQYASPSSKINASLIQLYAEGQEEEKSMAKHKIIDITLTHLQYDQWKEFKDYIDLQIYKHNVLPGQALQLIVALTLSKDIGVVALFDPIDDHYVFHGKIEGLAPIREIKFLPIEPQSYGMLAIDQVLDERLGSYFYEEFVEIFLYQSGNFQKVWKKTRYYEEIYKEQWIQPEANPQLWHKAIEETIIDYVFTTPLKVNTLTTLKKYTAQSKEFPKENQFVPNGTDSYQRAYFWSNEYNTFILGELDKEAFITHVALLEDLSMGRELLFGISNNTYKLITRKGELLYLCKNKFKPLFQHFVDE